MNDTRAIAIALHCRRYSAHNLCMRYWRIDDHIVDCDSATVVAVAVPQCSHDVRRAAYSVEALLE